MVVFDAAGNAGRPWPAGAAADEPPAPRRGVPPRRRPVGRRSARPAGGRWRRSTATPTEIVGVGICPIRCCKAFLKADGSLVEPVISWMDDRAYQPYVPDDPALAYATTTIGLHRPPVHRSSSRTRPPTTSAAVADRHRHLAVERRPGAVRRSSAYAREHAVRAADARRRDRPPHRRGRRGHRTAGGHARGGHRQRQGRRDAGRRARSARRTALVSLGTYIAAMVHGHENHQHPVSFWTNFACIPHRYLYESNGVRRGMWTLTWFLDLLGDEVAERAVSLGLSREQYIEREAALVPAGSDGLMTVLDWLATTDKPFRKGMMLGFDARHTRGHVYRAILEAIALTMKLHVDAMCAELGITLDEIVVSGGGSNSPLFMQIFADVFGIPASRSVDGGGASLGAAMCAAAATGVHPDIETAAQRMAQPRESFAPDAANGDGVRPHGRHRVPRHPRPHRRAVRARLPDLPLTPSPHRRKEPLMALTNEAIVEHLQQLVCRRRR